MRIVDCHAHFGYFARTKIVYADADSMVRAMDAANVEKLCVSSFRSIGPDCRAGNREVAEAAHRFPDRIVGYAAVNPNRPGEVREELERAFESPGMRAIKLHPAFHHYSIEGAGYRHAFDFAALRKLAILSHEWGTPAFLDRIATEFTQVRFIIAHTGFWNGRDEFVWRDVLVRRPNVFVDLVYSNIFYEAMERMVALVGAEKILWGSDFPLHDLPYQLGRVLFSKLAERERRLILGENMLRVLEGGN